jgi:hypothetical protein
MDYKNKYLKYKNKYLNLKKQYGGDNFDDEFRKSKFITNNNCKLFISSNLSDNYEKIILCKPPAQESVLLKSENKKLSNQYTENYGFIGEKKEDNSLPEIIEKDIDEAYLNNWIITQNYGEKNCGFYISDVFQDRVLVCREFKISRNIIEIYKEIMQKYRIFPILYSINYLGEKKYYESQRLLGDVTSLLYSKLPNDISYTKPFVDNRDTLLNLFTLKSFNQNIIFVSDFLVYLYKNRGEIDNFTEKFYEEYKKKSFSNMDFTYISNDNQEFKVSLYDKKPEDYKKKLQDIDNIISTFERDKIDFNLFEKFVNTVIIKIYKILPQLIKKIFQINYNLIELGYYYSDFKLDNYGYEILTPNDYKIYIIDFESGISKIENEEEKKCRLNMCAQRYNEKLNRFLTYGTNTLNTFLVNILDNNSIGLNDELFKILSTRFNIDFDKVIIDMIPEELLVRKKDNPTSYYAPITDECLGRLKQVLDITD